MTFFAPRRFKGFAATSAALAIAIALFGIAANFMATRVAHAMADGDSTMEGGQENIVGRRIAGVMAEFRSGAIRRDTELGVILGASAVGTDIDPVTLEKAAGPKIPARWLSLYANGANASDIRGLGELLTGTNLNVKLLVLAIHPSLIARSDHYLTDETVVDTRPFLNELKAGHITTAKENFSILLLTPLNRVFRERTRIGHQSRVLMADVKRRLLAAMGQSAESMFAPDRDPWSVRPLFPNDAGPVANERLGAQTPEGIKDGRVAAREIQEGPLRDGLFGPVKDKGWDEPSSYSPAGTNARDLVAMIRDVRSHKIEVILLLLPEPGLSRSRIPREATLSLNEALRDGFAGKVPLMIDFRDLVPDRMFRDHIHLRSEGRSLTTLRLIESLQARSADLTAQEKD